MPAKEDVFIEPGPHTYIFIYETDRQLRWFDGAPELYWNVTGNAWAFPIESAVVRRDRSPMASRRCAGPPIRAPTARAAPTSRGAFGSNGMLAVQTTRAACAARRPHHRRGDSRRAWSSRRARPTGRAISCATIAAGSSASWASPRCSLYYGWAWNAVGRDPKAGTIIPLFHPPEGVSPALASYIHGWGFGGNPWRAFTAAALSLAVSGLIVFDEKASGELTLERTKTKLSGGLNALPPGERAIFNWVEDMGGRGEINSGQRRLGEDASATRSARASPRRTATSSSAATRSISSAALC